MHDDKPHGLKSISPYARAGGHTTGATAAAPSASSPQSYSTFQAETQQTPRLRGVPRDQEWVLVIDDEEPLRTAVAAILREVGIRVLTASNGPSGVDLLRRHCHGVKLVLLDLSMPGMSGKETLRALRTVKPGVHVILSSAYDEQEAARCFANGEFTGYLQKPYTAELLITAVRRHL